VSLLQISKSPTTVQNRFSPLWDYHGEGSNWGISFIGVRQLSLFSHEVTANSATDHLFPLWWHESSPTESMNLFIPLWSDIQNHQTQERTFGVLGVGLLSLYYQQQNPAGTTARIFPFFRYTSDRIKDESEFWFLWPLFDHKTAQGRTTEISSLWWLFEYRSPKDDAWEYWVLGHPPIAMFMRTVSPTKTLVEFNPIIPGWRREYVEGLGTSWALFGGLIGMDAMPDGTHKLRLFWSGPDRTDKPKSDLPH
jgi:hypothetical protein